MVELLSPAGDLEKLKIAIHYGADAVYLGGQNFGLRANAKNFALDELKEAVKLAHNAKKRLYVTVNIVFHDENLIGLKEYLQYLDEINVDAIMISDISVLELCLELNLKLERYISTQASILNSEAALFYKELGVTRVVLAREALKEDVIEIKKATNMDIEAFIHGAMCTGFSGRCILSNYTTNRDSNRGGCAQICRWNFKLLDEKNNVVSDNFWMSCKDLNMVSNIKEMLEAGINSLKIEGRMRSIYYIATLLHSYRNILNKISTNTLTTAYTNYYLNILGRCANRETAPQFFNKFPGVNEQYYLTGRDEASNQDFLGIVLDNKDGVVTIEQRNYFKVGDVIQFFGPEYEVLDFEIKELYDENMEPIEIARHPQMIVKLKENLPVRSMDMMRIKIFDI